ncbi:MAG: hypothetical protein PUE07_05210 [bacterium]|nr:hypothetical protein [bacterium]
MKKEHCISCSKEITDKDVIALNKKLLGKDIDHYYCLECLADFLGVTVDELKDKIEEFKEEGCTLFQ